MTRRTLARPQRVAAFAIACALLAWAPRSVTAGSDPTLEWRTLSTAHFEIHHSRGYEQLARRLARVAEEAHRDLVPIFGVEPSERTHVLLSDFIDAANGSATVLPYNQIEVLAFPPEADSEIGVEEDWVRALFFHEYAHVLHMDQANGVPRAVNTVLGKTAVMNTAVPRWMLEGVATWIETKTTTGGRVGSPLFEMHLRSAALAGTLPALDQLTGDPLVWPYGTSRYLYGSYLMTELARAHGDAKVRAYMQATAGRIIPFGIQNLAREHFGETLSDAYERLRARIVDRARAIESGRRSAGLVIGDRVTSVGHRVASPVFSRTGSSIYYIRDDGHTRERVVERDLATGRERTLHDCFGGCERIVATPDGNSLVVTQGAPFRTYYWLRDLWRIPLGSTRSKPVRWTRGARVAEPDISPDGRSVCGVQTERGATRIACWDTADLERAAQREEPAPAPVIVRDGGGAELLATPRFAPDGRRLVYTSARRGRRDLGVIDLATGTHHALTRDKAIDLAPRVLADGRVLWASSRDGVFDLFVAPMPDDPTALMSSATRVTRVLGGAFDPSTSPDGRRAVYSGHVPNGYDLFVVDLPRAATADVLTAETPHVDYAPAPVEGREGPYDAVKSLAPRSWTPTWILAPDRLSRAGASLEGGDAVGHHGWRLAGDADTLTGYPAVSGVFVANRLWPTIGLTASYGRYDTRGVMEGRTRPYTQDALGGSAWIGLPFPRQRDRFDLQLSFAATRFRNVVLPRQRHDPGGVQPYPPGEGLVAGPSITLSYAWRERYHFSYTTERAHTFRLSKRLSHAAFGSDYLVDTYGWGTHHALPLAFHAALVFDYSGGYGRANASWGKLFSLGGIPARDLVEDLRLRRDVGGGFLRGFGPDAFSGDRYHLLNTELRVPAGALFRGLDTLPVYVERLLFVLFGDVGGAFEGGERIDRLRASSGAELRLSTQLGYGQYTVFRLGIARGFGPEGALVSYLVVGAPD